MQTGPSDEPGQGKGGSTKALGFTSSFLRGGWSVGACTPSALAERHNSSVLRKWPTNRHRCRPAASVRPKAVRGLWLPTGNGSAVDDGWPGSASGRRVAASGWRRRLGANRRRQPPEVRASSCWSTDDGCPANASNSPVTLNPEGSPQNDWALEDSSGIKQTCQQRPADQTGSEGAGSY